MKHRNLGKFIVAAAGISMALSPISALAKPATAILAEGETTVDTKALLNDAIKYAEDAKNDASYNNVVPKVKRNLESKLAAAKAVADDAPVTDINKAWSDLVDAVHYLDFTGNTADLVGLVDNYDDLKEENYKEGWAAFEAALNEAKDLLKNENALDKEIKEATDKLTAAYRGLKDKDPDSSSESSSDTSSDSSSDTSSDSSSEDPGDTEADKDELKKAIAEAEALNADDYTAESWKTLADALKAGKAVEADKKAEQGAVNDATNAIKQAINGLVKVDIENPVDKTELANALKANKELADTEPEGDASLNPETYGAFKKAYEAADAVNKDEDATQEAVDKAVADLKAAYEDLDQIMYRVYNPNNGEHLFTANKKEYDYLSANGWNGEDIAWIAPKASLEGATAMTRMYDKNSGEHHYTKNEKEIKALEDLGWTNEGKKWATAAKNENVIHRLYNPNETRAGRHHYTLNDKEKDHLDSIGWNWEHSESDLIYAKAPAPEKK